MAFVVPFKEYKQNKCLSDDEIVNPFVKIVLISKEVCYCYDLENRIDTDLLDDSDTDEEVQDKDKLVNEYLVSSKHIPHDNCLRRLS